MRLFGALIPLAISLSFSADSAIADDCGSINVPGLSTERPSFCAAEDWRFNLERCEEMHRLEGPFNECVLNHIDSLELWKRLIVLENTLSSVLPHRTSVYFEIDHGECYALAITETGQPNTQRFFVVNLGFFDRVDIYDLDENFFLVSIVSGVPYEATGWEARSHIAPINIRIGQDESGQYGLRNFRPPEFIEPEEIYARVVDLHVPRRLNNNLLSLIVSNTIELCAHH